MSKLCWCNSPLIKDINHIRFTMFNELDIKKNVDKIIRTLDLNHQMKMYSFNTLFHSVKPLFIFWTIKSILTLSILI